MGSTSASPVCTSSEPGASSFPNRWRSATEHDAHADNRDENIFGWIQPDEWDTVAGPNKNNFLRADCVECVTSSETSPSSVPSPLRSCGRPSCGYGAPCCEYSRRATHTKGLDELAPPFILRRSTKSTGPFKLPDLVNIESKSSLGVNLIDIIHGRSCRPISLLDLRTFLHLQRQPQKRLPSYFPASDMQSTAIDNSNLNLSLPFTLPPSSQLTEKKEAAQRIHYDEVDALDFLVAYERYLTHFRDQPRPERLMSPDPATCKAAVRAYVRLHCKPRNSCDLTAIDVLLQGGDNADGDDEIPEDISREVLARLKPADLGLRPETQPLRVEFDRLVQHYLSSRWVFALPSIRKSSQKSDSVSSSDTAFKQSASNTNEQMPRLRWMVDIGLISETELHLSLAECGFSTHPEVLAPVAEAVYAYMSQHVVPYFFISVARNLSPHTKRSRLMVGFVCTSIALVFSVLLIVSPSPLAPHANHGTGKILRWWRLLTAPAWCAGLGYILAYFTGLCVWLTIRGNREPDEEEEREREEIRSRISGEDVVGFDLAELQAAVDERDIDTEQDTNRWMAPEIARILTGIAGQSRRKSKKQRRNTNVTRLRKLEEGKHRSHSELTDRAFSRKTSSERSPTSEKLAKVSNAGHSPSTLAGTLSDAEHDAALTMPAAVIMHTPRRPSVTIGALDASGRPTTAHSALDTNISNSVRPSLDHVCNSLHYSKHTDVVSTSGHNSNAPALMRQKRVPLLKFSIGIVTAAEDGIAEEHIDRPVLTRDALLFDPELAARAVPPALATSPIGGTESSDTGSPHNSPSTGSRRKSLVQALLPVKPNGRRRAQTHEVEIQTPTRGISGEADAGQSDATPPLAAELAALSSLPVVAKSTLDAREDAPWLASTVVRKDLPASVPPGVNSPPTSGRYRLSANTSTTVVGPPPAPPSGPHRAYETLTAATFRKRLWTALQRGTGFAVGTERVLDARVRRAQQMKALRIMALNTLATIVVVAVVVAIP